MSKAFTREAEGEDDPAQPSLDRLPLGGKNYITPPGHERMSRELHHLVHVERPEMVRVVSWAASNGDRSENGDYLYGKKRLREIDRRIRFLTKRLENAVVVDPAIPREGGRIFFGATVTYADPAGEERTVSIVGVDEIDPGKGYVSWISPVASALLKAQEGDAVLLQTPHGPVEIDILAVRYQPLP